MNSHNNLEQAENKQNETKMELDEMAINKLSFGTRKGFPGPRRDLGKATC